jgi:hypothetical protein
MPGSTFTTMGAALKTRFYLDKNTIPDLTYEESPAFALIPKSEDWGGDNSTFPIILGQQPVAQRDVQQDPPRTLGL